MPNFDSKRFLSSISTLPGVYQMLDQHGEIIYIGKAKQLKNRLSSYFVNSKQLAPKTRSLVQAIADIKLTITHTEQEALILECNLIKKHRPRYNILMRDDKSYPYIRLTHQADYPRLDIYRGKKNSRAKFFGPYPNVTSVYQTVKLLQKLFKLRQCTDSYFNQRERPCLQYQIKRCSAPCMQYISIEAYAKQVKLAELFLQGKSEQVIADLQQQMEQAAERLAFEQASNYRDLIADLRTVQAKQFIDLEHKLRLNIDVFALVFAAPIACVAHLVIREGKIIVSQSYQPKVPLDNSMAEIMHSILAQYYLLETPSFGLPKEIITNICFSQAEKDSLIHALFNHYQLSIKIKNQQEVKVERAKCLAMAVASAQENLTQAKAQLVKEDQQMAALCQLFNLSKPPEYIECYDISHSQGEATIGSCVVFGPSGPLKQYYRRYNINNITPGDDYAALYYVLNKRYSKSDKAFMPDIIFIDGGKGQLTSAKKALDELGVLDQFVLVGVAKGPDRKAGLEQIIVHNKTLSLDLGDPALLFIQHIRDEAHRFAITGHRAKRAKKRLRSSLEDIPGVGATRRRALLKHFGGLQGVLQAGVLDLQQVPGISQSIAQIIYRHMHGE